MLDFIIDKKEVSIPNRWEDLTWKQAKEMPNESGPMYMDWVEYFTGIEDIAKRVSVADYAELAQAVSALGVEPNINTENYSRIFEYEGEEYTIEENIQMMKAAPYLDMMKASQQYAGKEEALHEGTETIAKLLIEYSMHNEEYDYNRAMKRDIDSMKFVDVSRMVAFFLLASSKLRIGTQENAPQQNGQVKRFRRGIRGFLKSIKWN